MTQLKLDWKVVFVLIIVVWFQMSMAPFLAVGDISPDFPFLFLAFFAFVLNHHRLLLYSFLMGCLKDLLANTFFGLETVSLVCGSLVLNQIASRFDRRDTWVQMWGTFLFSLSSLAIHIFLLAMVQESYRISGVLWLKSFLIAGYTTVLTILCFPIFRYIFKMKPYIKQYELF